MQVYYLILLCYHSQKNISKGEALQNTWLKSTYRVADVSLYNSEWNVIRVQWSLVRESYGQSSCQGRRGICCRLSYPVLFPTLFPALLPPQRLEIQLPVHLGMTQSFWERLFSWVTKGKRHKLEGPFPSPGFLPWRPGILDVPLSTVGGTYGQWLGIKVMWGWGHILHQKPWGRNHFLASFSLQRSLSSLGKMPPSSLKSTVIGRVLFMSHCLVLCPWERLFTFNNSELNWAHLDNPEYFSMVKSLPKWHHSGAIILLPRGMTESWIALERRAILLSATSRFRFE